MVHIYKQGISRAMQGIPSGVFVITARHEDHRAGLLAGWVQQVSNDPPMVMIAVEKGQSVLPLISNSGQFGLCQIQDGENSVTKKFSHDFQPDDDPFVGMLILRHTVTRVPIIANVLGYLECEVTSHFDIDGDHDLFIGHVLAGGYNGGMPLVHTTEPVFTHTRPLA